MRSNNPKQRCPALWYPMAGVALQLLVMEDVISSDPKRGSCYDFLFIRLGRTTFVSWLCLGHMGIRANSPNQRCPTLSLKKFVFFMQLLLPLQSLRLRSRLQ